MSVSVCLQGGLTLDLRSVPTSRAAPACSGLRLPASVCLSPAFLLPASWAFSVSLPLPGREADFSSLLFGPILFSFPLQPPRPSLHGRKAAMGAVRTGGSQRRGGWLSGLVGARCLGREVRRWRHPSRLRAASQPIKHFLLFILLLK